jgi:hypothetical protein
VRDPVVGRDVLCGALFGTLWSLVVQLDVLYGSEKLFQVISRAEIDGYLRGGLPLASEVCKAQLTAVFLSIGPVLGLVLMRLILRRTWLAVLVVTIGVAAISHAFYTVVTTLVLVGLGLVALFRFGLVSMIAGWFVLLLLWGPPLDMSLDAWHASSSIAVVAIVVATALFGFYHALAGRPILRDTVFQGDRPS